MTQRLLARKDGPVTPTDRRGVGRDGDVTLPAIAAIGVCKVYGPTVALAGATLTAERGSIHALLGENGAGKSTLVRILAGVEKADSGEVRVLGAPADSNRSRGTEVAFIHQDLALVQDMSAAANIALVRGFRRRAGLISDRATARWTAELFDRLEIKVDPRALIGELPLADQTLVAVARALSQGVQLIVLDEPTAYLETRQVQNLLRLLGRLRDEGVACLLITHRVRDVLDVCDALTVFRDGRDVATGSTAGMSEHEVVEVISGRPAAAGVAPAASAAVTERGRAASATVPVVARLVDASAPGVGPVSLTIGPGEIVGVCGLADSGAAEIGRLLFGLSHPTSGEVRLGDDKCVGLTPPAAIARRVAYVPGERKAAGLAGELSVRENVLMLSPAGWYTIGKPASERREVAALARDFTIYPPDSERVVSSFSGGNQQKILLAKWLRGKPKLVILNEPTAGVDVGAKADIHRHLRRLVVEQDLAVLLISSDFNEIAAAADRTYVMRHGTVVAEVDGADTDANDLVALAYGKA